MAFNHSLMLQEQNVLKESLLKAGLFGTQEDTFKVTGQQTDVFANPLVANLYAQTDITGQNIDAEELALQKLEQVKLYKEQMQRVESSSKVMRGSRLKKLRAMGNDFGEEVQKNAQAEFIREKVLAHIELLEKNDGLPDAEGFTAEEDLYAIMKERADKFSPLDPDRKIVWQEMLNENRESLDLEINIARRRKYVDEMLRPMLNDISGGQFPEDLMGNLMRSIMSLPAQLKLTQLMEERVERKHTKDDLEAQKADARATAEASQADMQRLHPEYKKSKRIVKELEQKYQELDEKAEKTLKKAKYDFDSWNYLAARSEADKALKELNKAKVEYEKLYEAYHNSKYSAKSSKALEEILNDSLAENEESELWRNDYQQRGNRYVAELNRMVRVPVSVSRNYLTLARELQLTEKQDTGDLYLYQTMQEWEDKADDFNEWVLNPANERAYKDYIANLARWQNNGGGQNRPTLDMPPLLQLSTEQQKVLINNLFECFEKRILVPRRYGLDLGGSVKFVYELLVVDKKQVLPAYGRFNPKRYDEFFSNPFAGLGTLNMQLFHDERMNYIQKMRQDGKSQSAIFNFEVYMGAYEKQMLLRKRDYLGDGYITSLSPEEIELLRNA